MMMKPCILVFLCLYTLVPGAFSQVLSSRCDAVFFTRDSIRFGATLTLPQGKKSFPGVVLVSGSGKQDRNGTMAGHPMFAVLADSLSRLGFAVLRVDDRGTGQTNGVYETATTGDFADDALAAIAYLKQQKGVDKVGLIGHSEGGAAAFIAAAKSKEVDFIVTLAGLATSGLQALRLQNIGLIEAAKIPDYDKARHKDINLRMYDTAYRYAYTPQLAEKLNATYNAWKHADDSAFAKDKPGEHDHMRFPIYSYVNQATGAWYQYHLRYDPVPLLKKIKVPILALNGDKDVMVPYKENLETVRKYGGKQATVKVMPGLNHLFQHCVTCTREESASLKETFAPEAWGEMRNWLKRFL
ncbi:alpha/beta hydrolase [Chitinophaga horti]|uniref:Alpha/beta hydrolase n=1 Tax=Chitinophaga horti TaxID=2920382 RepID=A0ABY6J836_9BACT|nr:alpha/beta hydrolase [Chitinophaga horti]UYQ95839.1 alpha/beta hydrolase [Chitinophaga horti]